MTNAIHRVFSRKLIPTGGPTLIASVAVLATFATLAAPQVVAQPRAGSKVRTQAAAEGASTWKADNCWYVFQGGMWRSQDLCRVMRGPAVYETYRPSTKTWMARIDESVPGWTMTRALNDPNAMWFKYRTHGGTNLFMLVNNQWVDAAGYIAQQRAATPIQTPQVAVANCPPIRGPFIAPNVRESVPMNVSCRTPEEKVWDRKVIEGIQTDWLLKQQRNACLQAQSSQPYRAEYKGRDNVPIYILNDGSQARPGGSLNPGWMWTASGPMQKQCF